MRDWMRRAWAWLIADWKRLLILPAAAAAVFAVVRLAWGRVVPSPPASGPAISPEQGAKEHAAIDADLAAKVGARKAEAESIKDRLGEKFGGKP